MGFFGKIKGIFYDEVEVDEPIEEISKVDRIVNKSNIEEEPKVEKIKFRDLEDLEEPIKEEKTLKTDNTFSERELFRSERTFNFTEFDDEEETLPPKRNVLDKEVRVTNNLDIKSSVPEQRIFKPTPVISPIYGILDKDYRKEEIKEKTDNNRSKMSSKITNYDTVRRKAYGTLEDELEDTLNSINKISTDTINKEVNSIEKDVQKLSKASKIEDLISKIDDVSEEIDKTLSIGELEDNVHLDNFDEEDVNEKTVSDNTLEHDLFNLIDSMYDDKED